MEYFSCFYWNFVPTHSTALHADAVSLNHCECTFCDSTCGEMVGLKVVFI